jgi:hypothetical protein
MWGALSDERTGLSFTITAALASAVILRSKSRETHDQVLLSQIREFPNLEGQVPVFNFSGTEWPQALGSLFVASYDSQDYNGSIRTLLQAGKLLELLTGSAYNISVRTS